MNLIIPYELLGRITVIALILFLVLMITGLILAYIVFKKKRIFFPHFLLFLIDSFYMPSKKIVSLFNGNEKMIDIVGVELRNILLEEKFRSIPYKDRIVLLPQCLRSLDCPIKFSSIEGAQCAKCGRCKVVKIVKRAEDLGYKGTYIAPGGGFVKRILKKIKPSGVLGIGCAYEVNWGMLEVSSKGIPCQGVIILRDGCVETDLDMDSVFERMEMVDNGG